MSANAGSRRVKNKVIARHPIKSGLHLFTVSNNRIPSIDADNAKLAALGLDHYHHPTKGIRSSGRMKAKLIADAIKAGQFPFSMKRIRAALRDQSTPFA